MTQVLVTVTYDSESRKIQQVYEAEWDETAEGRDALLDRHVEQFMTDNRLNSTPWQTTVKMGWVHGRVDSSPQAYRDRIDELARRTDRAIEHPDLAALVGAILDDAYTRKSPKGYVIEQVDALVTSADLVSGIVQDVDPRFWTWLGELIRTMSRTHPLRGDHLTAAVNQALADLGKTAGIVAGVGGQGTQSSAVRAFED